MTQKHAQTELANGPQPGRGNEGAPIIGPTNPAREAQHPNTLVPPRQDHGTLPNLRWSFADVSLAQWLAFTPHELVRAHLNIDESVLEKITTRKTPVVPA